MDEEKQYEEEKEIGSYDKVILLWVVAENAGFRGVVDSKFWQRKAKTFPGPGIASSFTFDLHFWIARGNVG